MGQDIFTQADYRDQGRSEAQKLQWTVGPRETWGSPFLGKFCLFYDKCGTSYKTDQVLHVSMGEIMTLCLRPQASWVWGSGSSFCVLPWLLSLAPPCRSSGESYTLKRRAHCARTIGPETGFLSRRKYLQEKKKWVCSPPPPAGFALVTRPPLGGLYLDF